MRTRWFIYGFFTGGLVVLAGLAQFSDCGDALFGANGPRWVVASAGNEPPDMTNSGGQSVMELSISPTPSVTPTPARLSKTATPTGPYLPQEPKR